MKRKNTMAKVSELKLDRSLKNIKNKDSEEKTMGIMEIIPESILMEILSRLSVREIGNIRIVLKSNTFPAFLRCCSHLSMQDIPYICPQGRQL